MSFYLMAEVPNRNYFSGPVTIIALAVLAVLGLVVFFLIVLAMKLSEKFFPKKPPGSQPPPQ